MTRSLTIIPRTASMIPVWDILDNWFEDLEKTPLFGQEKNFVPAFDITENEKEYIVNAEVPGIDPKDIEVNFLEGSLSVKGEKRQDKEEKGENYHRVERRYGSFHRSFRIPKEVQADKIGATYKDGILHLTLPKGEEKKVKKIEIKH